MLNEKRGSHFCRCGCLPSCEPPEGASFLDTRPPKPPVQKKRATLSQAHSPQERPPRPGGEFHVFLKLSNCAFDTFGCRTEKGPGERGSGSRGRCCGPRNRSRRRVRRAACVCLIVTHRCVCPQLVVGAPNPMCACLTRNPRSTATPRHHPETRPERSGPARPRRRGRHPRCLALSCTSVPVPSCLARLLAPLSRTFCLRRRLASSRSGPRSSRRCVAQA